MIALLALLLSAASLPAQTVPVRAAVEELRLDGIDADFSRIVHVAVDRHGNIVVAQPDDGYLRVFDASGTELGRIGRRGGGPGEFQSIVVSRGWVADTFWQADGTSRRVSFWQLPDSLLRDVAALRPNSGDPAANPGIGRLIGPHVVGVLPDGSALVRGPFLRAEGDRGWAAEIRDSAAVVLLRTNSGGDVAEVIAVWPAVSAGCRYRYRGQLRAKLECLKWVWGISADSRRIGYAGIGIEAPRPEAVNVVMTRPSGDTIFVRQLPISLVDLTADDADSMRARLIGRAARDGRRLDKGAIQTPDFFRPVTRLVVGRDGTTWLKLRVSRSEYRWLVLGPDGSILEWASLPPGLRIEVAERGRVWGTERDADGIQSVVRYRIQ